MLDIMATQHIHRQVVLHLSLIHGIGPLAALKVLRLLFHQTFPDVLHVGWTDILEHQQSLDFQAVYDLSLSDFIRVVGLGEKTAQLLVQGLENKDLLYAELDLAQASNATILTMLDDEYPEILKQIQNPPLVLYTQGAPLRSQLKGMGIVGSRKATSYAQHVIQGIVPGLVMQGWQIVSGGAEGADTMAHTATLQAGGSTIAVLGSGLLQPYPDSNRTLFKQMIESSSTVVSPFRLNELPERGNFPARNRVISGLSFGCVVVQAAAKSGALITAHCALEQGRQVFAVPGLIHDSLSAGCHALIKQGAKLVNHVNDVLEEFSEYCPQVGIIPAQKIEIPSSSKKNQKNTQDISDPFLAYFDEPMSLDDLLEKANLDVAALQDKLFGLQLEGKLRQTFTGMWERIEG